MFPVHLGSRAQEVGVPLRVELGHVGTGQCAERGVDGLAGTTQFGQPTAEWLAGGNSPVANADPPAGMVVSHGYCPSLGLMICFRIEGSRAAMGAEQPMRGKLAGTCLFAFRIRAVSPPFVETVMGFAGERVVMQDNEVALASAAAR